MNPDELAQRILDSLKTDNHLLTEWQQNGYITLADGARLYPVIAPGETPDFSGEFTPLLKTGMDWNEI